jgi:hypothetical protein
MLSKTVAPAISLNSVIVTDINRDRPAVLVLAETMNFREKLIKRILASNSAP